MRWSVEYWVCVLTVSEGASMIGYLAVVPAGDHNEVAPWAPIVSALAGVILTVVMFAVYKKYFKK